MSAIIQALPGKVGCYEHLLRDIIGVLLIAEQMICMSMDTSSERFIELAYGESLLFGAGTTITYY